MLAKYIVNQTYIDSQHKSIEKMISSLIRGGFLTENQFGDITRYISFNHFLADNRLYFSVDQHINRELANPIGCITKTNYAYVRVPAYSGKNENITEKFSYIILNMINELHSKNPDGWVFDFRGNTGGIIYSFVLGFMSILSPFTIDCVDKNNVLRMKLICDEKYLYYKYENENTKPEIIGSIPPLKKLEISNVNVLTDIHTASCGELLTHLLRSQHNAIVYGEDTYGISTWMEYHKYLLHTL